MVERLKTMPIDDEIRELIRHALVWIWKDEEMHTIYIRGAILKLGSLSLRLQAYGRQFTGALGGWASSVLQHVHWRRAPLSYILAQFIIRMGILFGSVPAEVQDHIQYGSFRDFCLFNIEAEKTAWLCWSRLVELAEANPSLVADMVEDFRRVVADEDHHEQIFAILVTALDEQDRLVEEVSAKSLAEQIRGVSKYFLPRSLRGIDNIENPLGSGGQVYAYQGQATNEKVTRFEDLLAESGLQKQLVARAQFLGKPIESLTIAIKTTFMMGYHLKDKSPMTDPVLVEALAQYLQTLGCADIIVVEGQTMYDHFYKNRSVHEVATYFNIQSPHYRLVDTTQEQIPHEYARGMAQYTVSQTWKEADFRISFGKVRSHPIELAILSVANVEWVGERCDEFIFAERQANRATAAMMLLDEFPPHFALLDGYDLAPDGLVGVMGSPHPKSPKRLYAGVDALAVDTVAARHLGINHPRESSILLTAYHWFGGWSKDIAVIGIDEPISKWRGPYDNDLWTILSFLAYPVYQFFSGRGALFVPEMDEDAFPPLKESGIVLRMARWGVRVLLGLRH